jgi:metallophosphoesterase superfamily enzyme
MKHGVILERAEKQQAMLINCAKHQLLLDASGALIWPKHKLLVVSDLHFEKGSYFASRGSLIQSTNAKSLSHL